MNLLQAVRSSYPSNLPVVEEKDRIIDAIKENQVVIVAGDTGSGKTTQLPKMCLEAGRGEKGLIGCTQPRRLAATSVAERVREELGPGFPAGVDYKIRFRDQTGPATRIKFMTDGILLAETSGDRGLSAYDTIIIDEAHERSLNIDFLLGILKRLKQKRPELKIIITSATIDTEKFSKAFDQAPVIEVSGRTHPVEIRYLEEDGAEGSEDEDYIEKAVQGVFAIANSERPGDILVFMPTEKDIRETVKLLTQGFQGQGGRQLKREENPLILPLFGRLTGAEQNRIFRDSSARKIVVATNVAETSVTVPGIRYVVDTGLARIASYNPGARTTRLPIRRISRASCDQRAGRCGRIGPGVCLRLYTEEDYWKREEFTAPEILRANLAEVILRMIDLRLGDPRKFPFVDPPSARNINDGYKSLQELGAITEKRKLTDRGRTMAALPLDPRISRMIIEARSNNCLREVVVIAAALSIQDPRVRPAEQAKQADEAHSKFVSSASDFITWLHLWDRFQALIAGGISKGRLSKFCKQNFLSFQRMREWREIHEQIWGNLAGKGGKRKKGVKHPYLKTSCLDAGPDSNRRNRDFSYRNLPFDYENQGVEAVHKAILSGNLRNIGLKKDKNIYQGGGGKGFMIFPGSGQFDKGGQWIMAGELVETSRLFAHTVAPIKVEWLEPLAGSLCRSSYSSPRWEKKRGQVTGLEKVTLFGLPIVSGRRINYGGIRPEEAREIFIQSALVEGELGGRPQRFLKHNLALVEELADLEDRMRRRDIRVDDFTLADFYEQRLPADIVDRAGLSRYLKNRGSDDFLFMKKEDIVNTSPESGELDNYPKTMESGGLNLPLSYSFEPGREVDGITVRIPAALSGHVRRDDFEWLVPGLLQEKVSCLLKGLPKNLRRQLVPIPETARELMAAITFRKGSLFQQLEDLLLRYYRVRVDRGQWDADCLPLHLRMNFALVDEKDRVVAEGRDFSEVVSSRDAVAAAAGSNQEGLNRLRKKWERSGITGWDFADIPERIPVKDEKGNLTGFAWPGLRVEQEGTVAVRLFAGQRERCIKTRQGLLLLYRHHFTKQWKAAEKDFTVPRAHWALYQGICGHEEFNRRLVDFIMSEVFEVGSGVIPTEEEFNRKINQVKKSGLYHKGREIRGKVMELLRERRSVLDSIEEAEKKGRGMASQEAEKFRNQVAEYLSPDFPETVTARDLDDLLRYLKALKVRLTRKIQDPAKDKAKEDRITPFLRRLSSCPALEEMDRGQRQVIEDYRKMLEEYRVSIFAPEIKPGFPVSEKRLEKKWKEVIGCIN